MMMMAKGKGKKYIFLFLTHLLGFTFNETLYRGSNLFVCVTKLQKSVFIQLGMCNIKKVENNEHHGWYVTSCYHQLQALMSWHWQNNP